MVLLTAREAMAKCDQRPDAVGLANQRETALAWDAESGKPLYRAISWQDRRTAPMIDEISADEGLAKDIKQKTGLIPNPYFSAAKYKWLLDNVPGLRDMAKSGRALLGTVDSFLIWRLSGGKSHITDYTNASRTMLFDIRKMDWDDELLEVFGVPREALPEPRPPSEFYGYSNDLRSELAGSLGDQSAALLGQAALDAGQVKSTYGTGTFVLANSGKEPAFSSNLLTTLAWSSKGVSYALEGSAFSSGSALDWLISLGMISSPEEANALSTSVKDAGGVFFVPGLSGLGAPFWDPRAKAAFMGITSATSKAHMVRAVMESMAYQVEAILREMRAAGVPLRQLKVDGGISNSDFLMQFQADVSSLEVQRGEPDSTALGAAYVAAMATGKLEDSDIRRNWKPRREFIPLGKGGDYDRWIESVKMARLLGT